ncbi:MAG: hypothetical protein ACREIL_04355 [Nitrospiraceae bacterium]
MTASSGNLVTRLDAARREQQGQEELQADRVRRYAYRVTAALIVLCNAVLLLGVWVSGVNLDTLFTTPDRFNPVKDICVRLSWHKVAGVERPVQLCYEWINLSDPSGDTHKFQAETQVVKGADGKLYFDDGVRMDYRVFILGAFVAAVVVLGIALKRSLIARYRGRLPTRVAKV